MKEKLKRQRIGTLTVHPLAQNVAFKKTGPGRFEITALMPENAVEFGKPADVNTNPEASNE